MRAGGTLGVSLLVVSVISEWSWGLIVFGILVVG